MAGLVIFDLDGTLINTIEDLGTAVNFAMRAKGWPEHTMAEYERMIGNGVRKLVTRATPEQFRENNAEIDSALNIFEEYYFAHIDTFTKPYPGIPEMLMKIEASGVKMAVATNKIQAGADRLIAELFPEVHFDLIYGNSEGHPLKPDPEVIKSILSSVGENAADAVYAGDTEVDMQTATQGGVKAIGVTWGYRDRSGLGLADIIVDTTDELLNVILSK